MAKSIADELMERRAALIKEIQKIAQRGVAEDRDLSHAEQTKFDEMYAEAEKLAERAKAIAAGETKAQEIEASFRRDTGGSSVHSSGPADEVLAEFGQAIRERRTWRGVIEERAVTTSNAGARTDVFTGNSAFGYIYQQAGIEFQPADALHMQAPKFGALTATAPTSEGAQKPSLTDPTLASVTIAAYARLANVTDQVLRFGVGSNVVRDRLIAEIVNDINKATVDKLITEAGTALTFATSASHMVDLGIARVADDTGRYPSLIVTNPTDYPLLSQKTATADGAGIGSRVVAWNGVPIVASKHAAAGFALVVDGGSFKALGTELILKTHDKIDTNELQILAERYFALGGPTAPGGVVSVDLVAA